MDTLEKMRIFTRVVEAGSFTAAAQQLNESTASTSRAVARLEAHLRARLLNRTTRRVVLTEAGERYLHRCEQILACVDQAEAEAFGAQASPSGKLKLHLMSSFGHNHVVPAIVRYQQRYPAVKIDLTFEQRVPDLLDEGYDVSIILAPKLPDSSLVVHRLGSVTSIVCASPTYISKNGAPRDLSDLRRHTCLHLATPVFPSDKWVFCGPDGLKTVELGSSAFTANTAEALEEAIREGHGVGVLPIPSALPGMRTGTLVRVLPQFTLQEMNLYVLYPSRRFVDAKIRTFIEFLREDMPAALAHDTALLRQIVPQ